MGFRTPGEKTMYEVQRLENAAARIFQTKITQFEEQILEPMLNAMLEMARRKLDSTTIRIFDPSVNAVVFESIKKEDLAVLAAFVQWLPAISPRRLKWSRTE